MGHVSDYFFLFLRLPSLVSTILELSTDSHRRVCAFLILVLLIFANMTIVSRLPPSPAPLALKGFIQPFTERAYVMTVASAFLYFLGLFVPINYIAAQAINLGMSQDLAQYLIPILNAARQVPLAVTSHGILANSSAQLVRKDPPRHCR